MNMQNGIDLYCAKFEQELESGQQERLTVILASYDEKAVEFTESARRQNRAYQLLSIFDYPYFSALYETARARRMDAVQSVLLQYTRHEALKTAALGSGCDHSSLFGHALDSMACNDFAMIDTLFPESLGLARVGYVPYVMCTNLLMAIWHGTPDVEAYCRERLPKVLEAKRTGRDLALIHCLTAILDRDPQAVNRALNDLCISTQKVRDKFLEPPLSKCFCIKAHGLYNLAYRVFPEDARNRLEPPDHPSFWRELAEWQCANPDHDTRPYIVYRGKLEFLNLAFRTLPRPVELVKKHGKLLRDTDMQQTAVNELILSHLAG